MLVGESHLRDKRTKKSVKVTKTTKKEELCKKNDEMFGVCSNGKLNRFPSMNSRQCGVIAV